MLIKNSLRERISTLIGTFTVLTLFTAIVAAGKVESRDKVEWR